MKNSNLGRKLVLWRYKHRNRAYTDQTGASHGAAVVLEEFPVTIVEVKQVKNRFGKGTDEAWMATSEKGEVFTCNWESFPDDTLFPVLVWDSLLREQDDEPWSPVDACQALNVGLDVFVTPRGERAIPVGATLCKHNRVSLSGDACYKCEEAEHRKSLRPRPKA